MVTGRQPVSTPCAVGAGWTGPIGEHAAGHLLLSLTKQWLITERLNDLIDINKNCINARCVKSCKSVCRGSSRYFIH